MPTTLTWPISASDLATDALARIVSADHGVLRPFQRDGKGDFANGHGRASIRASIGQILGTIAGSPLSSGELAWRPEFGSIIELLRQRNNDDVLADLARVYVIESLQRWEKRIRITDAQITAKPRNVMTIRVFYDVVARPSGTVLVAGLVDVFDLGTAEAA